MLCHSTGICPFLNSLEGGVRSVIDIAFLGEYAPPPIPLTDPYVLYQSKLKRVCRSGFVNSVFLRLAPSASWPLSA